MTALLFLIPITILLGLLGLYGFFWTVKNNQYDDIDGAAQRILLDDEPANKKK